MSQQLFDLRVKIYVLIIIILLIRRQQLKNEYSTNESFNLLKNSHEQIVAIEERLINFEKFDNNSGSSQYLVPNIFHYVNLDQNELKFAQFLSILSVIVNQKPKPNKIYLHCNLCNYTGKYWDELKKLDKSNLIVVKKLKNYNRKIFEVEPEWIHHKSDILRLLVIMKFGGIYLDNDMLLINSFDKYRKYEICVSWDSDTDGIGNQIFIANKNARFLRAIYDQYRNKFDRGCWYCNGGFIPRDILLQHRYLVHAVKIDLGTHMLIGNLFHDKNWKEWRKQDAIHLLMNHRSYLDKDSPIKEFDEINVKNYSFTFGEIARDILKRAHAFDF